MSELTLFDWLFLASFIITTGANLYVFGVAGVVVYWLLLFAAYRLGRAMGR